MKRRVFVSEVPTGEPRERQRVTKSKGNMVSFTISLPYSIVREHYMCIPTGYAYILMYRARGRFAPVLIIIVTYSFSTDLRS